MKKTPKILKIERRIGEPIDKYLRREYVDERMSTSKIGDRLGTSDVTIINWLREFNIKTRNNSETQLPGGFIKPSKMKLRKMYLDDGLSMTEIGERLGISCPTVRTYLKGCGFPIRDNSKAHLSQGVRKPTKKQLEKWYVEEKQSSVEIGRRVGVGSTTVQRWLEKHQIRIRSISESRLLYIKRPSKAVLRELYVKQGMSSYDIADKIGVSGGAVLRWLKKNHILLRSKGRLGEGIERPSKKKIEYWYVEERKSTIEIAKIVGVRPATINSWLRKYNIPIRSNKPMSNSQFQDFLKNNQPALNLAGVAVTLNGTGTDIEKIILEVYNGEFKDIKHLHGLLERNKDDIRNLVKEGLTNLGTYIGKFSLEERAIVPILIGQTISSFGDEKITRSIEDKIIHILRSQYSPAFNDNPQETISKLERTIGQYEGKARDIYQRLYNHYQEVLQLQEELS